jgi:hypothetical protein
VAKLTASKPLVIKLEQDPGRDVISIRRQDQDPAPGITIQGLARCLQPREQARKLADQLRIAAGLVLASSISSGG